MGQMTGRIALITGASSGFGEHFARLFVAHGARVVIGARRADRIAALAEEHVSTGLAADEIGHGGAGEPVGIHAARQSLGGDVCERPGCEPRIGKRDLLQRVAGIGSVVTTKELANGDFVLRTNDQQNQVVARADNAC